MEAERANEVEARARRAEVANCILMLMLSRLRLLAVQKEGLRD